MIDSIEHNFVFWTEGGRGIGMGHISRSLVIAGELLKCGHHGTFIINDDPSVRDRLTAEGFTFTLGDMDARSLPPFAGKAPKTIVLDTKKDVTALMQTLKSSGHRLILLDNITPARLAADVVIYPSAIFENDLDWAGFTGRVYGGARYVPVDGTYLQARERYRSLKHEPPYCILVTMGGSDPGQLTHRIVGSLLPLPRTVKINVVIGPAFTTDPRLSRLEKENTPGLTFIRGQANLASLMAGAHLAFTAVGTTIYELATVGVPAIIIANYAEDRRDLERYRKLGMNLPLGFYRDVRPLQIREAASRLIRDAATWQKMRDKSWQMIDGRGAGRIVECLLAPT
jgi:spore coat polysaccharide biosynthesis predicted glycosyltransferase SpsG